MTFNFTLSPALRNKLFGCGFLLLLVPTIFLINPKKTEACIQIGKAASNASGVAAGGTTAAISVPVTDYSNLVQNSITAGSVSELESKECLEDAMAFILIKTLLRQMTDSIVAWINSGFDGNPAFIQDPKAFFLGVADATIGTFIESTELGFLCSPFQINVKLGLAFKFGVGFGASFSQRSYCTLSQIINNVEGAVENANIDAFIAGDFQAGGWNAWYNMTQKDQNNPYGAFMMANAELTSQIQVNIGNEKMVLDWGSGFKSATDAFGKILTPGKTIETQLSNALGADLRGLEIADEVNEIVGALVGQLVAQVMGPGGLAGTSGDNPNQAGFSTNTPIHPEYAQNWQRITSLMDQPESSPDLVEPVNARFNLALGRGNYTRMSSTARGTNNNTGAENAVDGITNGLYRYGYGSIAITGERNGGNEFWEIDLGAENIAIGDVEIFPQTTHEDEAITSEEAVGEFRIFIKNSATKISGNLDPKNPQIGNEVDWASETYTMRKNGPMLINVNRAGQVLRIQRVDGVHRLRLAEVKIWKNIAPKLDLDGENPTEVEIGKQYKEKGIIINDNSDKLKNKNSNCVPADSGYCVKVIHEDTINGKPVQSIDTNAVGRIYYVEYIVTDSGGAKSNIFRKVEVVQKTTITASCSPSVSSAKIGEAITWKAVATGGVDTFTYAWDGAESLSGSTAEITKVYAQLGIKDAKVTINSGNATKQVTCIPVTIVEVPGQIVVSRLSDALTPQAGANAKIGTSVEYTTNPSAPVDFSPGSYTALATDLAGFTETGYVCTYPKGGTVCTATGATFSTVTCANGFCELPVNVTSDTVTHAIFKYSPIVVAP